MCASCRKATNYPYARRHNEVWRIHGTDMTDVVSKLSILSVGLLLRSRAQPFYSFNSWDVEAERFVPGVVTHPSLGASLSLLVLNLQSTNQYERAFPRRVWQRALLRGSSNLPTPTAGYMSLVAFPVRR